MIPHPQQNLDKIVPRDLFFKVIGALSMLDGKVIINADGMQYAKELLKRCKDVPTPAPEAAPEEAICRCPLKYESDCVIAIGVGACSNQKGNRDVATIRNQTLDKIIPTLGRAIQTDISDNDYVMIEDLESVIESLRTPSTQAQQHERGDQR